MKNATIEIECMHCQKKYPVMVRDADHLEELLRTPVGECPDCEHVQTLITEEEANELRSKK